MWFYTIYMDTKEVCKIWAMISRRASCVRVPVPMAGIGQRLHEAN
jgi:hypothetical protein